MKLVLNSNRKDFYRKYYQALNGILNLSKKELEILAEFSKIRLTLDESLSEEQKNIIIFSAEYRKLIAEKLGITVFNLNNYIKFLKDRGILSKTGRVISINPGIFIDISRKGVIDVNLKFNIS